MQTASFMHNGPLWKTQLVLRLENRNMMYCEQTFCSNGFSLNARGLISWLSSFFKEYRFNHKKKASLNTFAVNFKTCDSFDDFWKNKA